MSERHRLEQVRLEKLERLRRAGMDPYPNRASRSHTSAQAIQAFQQAGADQAAQVSVAGRIRSLREMGQTAFAHLEDEAGRLQLYFRSDELGEERLTLLQEAIDLGDFLAASGTLFKTRTGEITLRVADFHILAKALLPLPAAKEELVEGKRVVHSAFDNPEMRYRQRYADLAVNPEVREVFRSRARIVDELRRFLNELG